MKVKIALFFLVFLPMSAIAKATPNADEKAQPLPSEAQGLGSNDAFESGAHVPYDVKVSDCNQCDSNEDCFLITDICSLNDVTGCRECIDFGAP